MRGFASPPVAATEYIRPAEPPAEKRMVPDSLQSVPAFDELGIAQTLCTVPSARLSLRSSPPAKNATERPSGDQAGMSLVAPSVPASG